MIYPWALSPTVLHTRCEGSHAPGVCPEAGASQSPSKELIEEFAAKVDKLYIFEELEPVVEEQVSPGAIKKGSGQGNIHGPGRIQRKSD